MSEVHIRINKRAIERALFLVVIIVLAVLLFMRWDAPVVDESEITALQAQNQELTAQIAALETEVETLQAAQVPEPEAQSSPEPTPEPEAEPEETLSGDLDITWDVRMNGDRFEQVTVVFDNGRDRSEDLNYRLYWESLSPEFINHEGALYIASGGRQTRVIESGSGSIPGNPGPGVDTIVLRVTDSAQNTVAELRERVR